jgi:hypothetical protein
MPQYDFKGFGGVSDALEQELMRRYALERQAALDDLNRRNTESIIADRAINREIQRGNVDAWNEQRAAAADERRTKLAGGIAGMLSPDQEIDQETADTLKAGHLGPLVGPGQQKTPRVIRIAPDDGTLPSAQLSPDVSAATFRGTPGQIDARRKRQDLDAFLSDPNTPDNVKQFITAQRASGDSSLPYQLFASDESKQVPVIRVNPRSGAVEQVGTAPKGAHFVNEPKIDQADAPISLTPQGLDAAADVYAMTGQLPPMGMGKNGAAVRAAVINRAAERHPDLNIVANKAETAANTASLGQLQKNYDAVEAFAKTAAANRQAFDQIKAQVPDTGTRLLNQPWRAIARSTGNTTIAQFDVIRQSLQNEYARLVSQPSLAGQLSDSARHEIESGLSPNATIAQLDAALTAFGREAENRRQSFKSQITDVRGRLGGRSSSTPATNDPLGIRR